MADFFAEREGRLYLAMHWPATDEAVDVISYYPTGIKTRDYAEYVGRRAFRAGPGVYQPETSNGLMAPRFALLKWDKTLPEFVERIPIPCPKVRRGIRTRYCDGQWQKLLKPGWVRA